jgi:amino acid transporter
LSGPAGALAGGAPAPRQRVRLERILGPWDVAAITVNAVIGAGILGLPGRLYALVGVWCVPLGLAGGALAALIALCLAELGSRFARTGGIYLYVHTAFGPAAGFAVGWLNMVTVLLGFATIANLVVIYLAAFLPWLGAGWARNVFLAALVAALALPVYRGVRLSARAHQAFTLCKLALLAGFVVVTLPALLRHGMKPAPLPAPGQVVPALVLLLFAFMGMEATVISGGEMRHPARDVPFALAVATVAVIALYSLVFLGSIAAVPDLAHATRPLFDGARAVLGPAGGAAVVAGGATSMAGVLFVILFALPRIVFALAEHGQLPRALARLHPRFHTPGNAVIAVAVLAYLLAANSTFLGAVTGAALTRLLLYAAGIAALLRFRKTGYAETASPFMVRGGGTAAWLALAVCLGIVADSTRTEFTGLLAMLAPGMLIFALRRSRAPMPAVRDEV